MKKLRKLLKEIVKYRTNFAKVQLSEKKDVYKVTWFNKKNGDAGSHFLNKEIPKERINEAIEYYQSILEKAQNGKSIKLHY